MQFKVYSFRKPTSGNSHDRLFILYHVEYSIKFSSENINQSLSSTVTYIYLHEKGARKIIILMHFPEKEHKFAILSKKRETIL